MPGRIRIISILVIIYSFLALGWWATLLYKKNENIYHQRLELEALKMEVDTVEEIEAKYNRQKLMIISEGLVFGISLLIGIWIINKASTNQVRIATQKNNFLLSVTHELKSPIASIKLILQTLLNKKISPEQIKLITDNGLKETNRLESMINKLLMSSKIEDDYTYHFESIELKEFLGKLISRKNQSAEHTLIEFQSPKKVYCKGDPEALQSVFSNLIENARKYSPEDALIHISLTQKNEEAHIAIADHGPGIPQEEKSKIFTKFYRIGNEEYRKTEGSGLGLFIVKKIIESHQGKIIMKDNKPKGNIAYIILKADSKTDH